MKQMPISIRAKEEVCPFDLLHGQQTEINNYSNWSFRLGVSEVSSAIFIGFPESMLLRAAMPISAAIAPSLLPAD